MSKNKEKLKEQAKVKELTDTLQRLQADFENYKKRAEKEKEQTLQYAIAKFIQQILPIIDAFELAMKNNKNHEQFAKGVEMIYSQLHDLLHTHGLQPIEAIGQKLDPNKHEVLLQEVKEDCDDDTIIEEIQKGYMLNDAVLRTAKVKIAKKGVKNNVSQKNTA